MQFFDNTTSQTSTWTNGGDNISTISDTIVTTDLSESGQVYNCQDAYRQHVQPQSLAYLVKHSPGDPRLMSPLYSEQESLVLHVSRVEW